MGKIIINGNEYSGSAENAEDITYDNSALTATNVQDALDEIVSDPTKGCIVVAQW